MREGPILFSAPMVRALLAGTKTQTRRVVKQQPPADKQRSAWYEPGVMGWAPPEAPSQHWHRIRCPYGQPGDRLWVREAFAGSIAYERHGYPLREWGNKVWYVADGEPRSGQWTRPRPSIHMPRSLSRITLEIAGVRVERLQDISEADAIAEGVNRFPGCRQDDDAAAFNRIGPVDNDSFPIARYAVLWESINGLGSWDANPWVWVVDFKRVQP
ncbi:hypothetical protein MW290_25555 [Aquincola tertiaricarbonis]|uniref:Phage-related protein n=1 Tax=Aquincola tertiaricarbonis TaxID=391953 RepID=A0ABY4S7G7_AQUTE|nr:hypothetical protein [Aquincola tertiaricarbonis]URI08938.1 hypothetical protein MW290_25555 [Aquincola tertiaricarbonis]